MEIPNIRVSCFQALKINEYDLHKYVKYRFLFSKRHEFEDVEYCNDEKFSINNLKLEKKKIFDTELLSFFIALMNDEGVHVCNSDMRYFQFDIFVMF